MQIQPILKELKFKIKELYKERLKQIMLYGSWARGEATEHSDIDLLIILRGEVRPGREIDRMIDMVSDMNLKYNVLISIYPISEQDYNKVNSPLIKNVKVEGIAA